MTAMTTAQRTLNWRDAYEERVVLWRFWHTVAGQATGLGFAHDLERKGEAAYMTELHKRMAEFERIKLAHASPIWVDADMVDLVHAAAESFGPEELHAEDLITPYGFALLEKPLILSDVAGKEMSWRAISWGPLHVTDGDKVSGPEGINLLLYAGTGDPDGYGYDELVAGTDLARYYLSAVHMHNMPFGVDPKSMDGNVRPGVDPEWSMQSHLQGWGLLQVLWRLMLQRISTKDTRHVDRKARRRAVREGLTEDDAVQVVTLRRLRQEGDAAQAKGNVEWSHRWTVDGHWRNQWYPSLNRHRRVWISPYVKGPEDKELRIKNRAYQLVR